MLIMQEKPKSSHFLSVIIKKIFACVYLFLDGWENLLQVEIYKLDKDRQREVLMHLTQIYNALTISRAIYTFKEWNLIFGNKITSTHG